MEEDHTRGMKCYLVNHHKPRAQCTLCTEALSYHGYELSIRTPIDQDRKHEDWQMCCAYGLHRSCTLIELRKIYAFSV